jgi:hypothetical protein
MQPLRVGRGCPCHLAGRSLRASCPALTPRKLAPASCLSLACEAGESAPDATSSVGRGCPCHLAGRSLRASCPSLTPRKLASASCLSLACEAGSMARATPTPDPLPHKSPGREPGDCGNKGHPAIHVTPRYSASRRSSLAVSSWCATSQSPSSRRGLLCRTGRAQRNGNPASRSLARPARWHGQPRPLTLSHIKAPGASPGTAGTKATLRSMSPRVTWRHAVRAWLFPMGVPRRSPPARAGGFYWQRTPRSTRRAAHAVRHTPGRGWP